MVAALACASGALCPAPASAGVRSLSVGVKGTYDVGTPFVTGTASGLGAGAALRFTFGADHTRWELSLDADIAGFTGEGDGDPILQLAASLGRREYIGHAAPRLYWFAGAGAGILGLAGARTAFPLRVGLGVSVGGATGLDLALFERFTVLHGSGDPAFDYINTVGVEVALRFGR